MKTLADLFSLIELVISPGFDLAAAEKRIGPFDCWLGERARFKSRDPSLDDPMVETLSGEVRGLQTRLSAPLRVEWAGIELALGQPVDEFVEVDDFWGPTVYQFARAPSGSPAMIMLEARRAAGDAQISAVIVRHKRAPRPRVATP